MSSIGFYEHVDAGYEVRLNEAGQIVITGNGQQISGINIRSESGSLVPIASGDLAADSGPFSFFVANNENQVTLANLGATVTLNELVLDIGVDAADLSSSDLVFEIAVGPEVRVVRFDGNEVIPEPQSQSLAFLASLTLLARQRRSRLASTNI